MKNRKHILLSVVAACVLAAAGAAQAQTTQPIVADAKGDVVKLSEIVGVDKAARTVDIKGPKGRVATYAVDPRVKNFDQIKVSDRVRLDYEAAIALALVKGGNEIREKVESQSVASAPAGAKPGI